MSGRVSDLVKWAVYRTLDTRTGAIYDHSGLRAPERLSLWREAGISDADMLAEITKIYA